MENRKHGSVKLLVGEIGEQQRTLLKHLISSQKLTDSDIRRLLTLRNNKAVAGILTGISRRAKSAGIESAILVKIVTRNGTGERHYQYSIAPQFIEEVKEGLGIKA